MHELVQKARSDYRKAKGYTDDQYLTLFAPGNTEKEIKFSFPKFAESLKIFHNEEAIKNVNKGFFKILILTPKDEVTLLLFRKLQASSNHRPRLCPDTKL